jgi:hypothetical protein
MTLNCLHGLKTESAAHGGSKRRRSPDSPRRIIRSLPPTRKPEPQKHHSSSSNSKDDTATIPTRLEKVLWKDALPEIPSEWESHRQEVVRIMGMKWADSTKRARSRLYDELLETMTAAPEVPLQTTAAIMVQKKGVAIQTKLSYAKNLQTILRSMGEETTVISAYIAGLRVMGAEKPIKQADPITKQQLLEIECPPHVKTALLLAWKTASRMDEIARLEKDSIVESTPEMIVVNFSDRTKKSRGKPFLPENMCIVTGDLTTMLHESLPAAMDNWPTRAELSRYLPHPFTDHSIKHGAAIVLMEAAAENKFDKELVSLVLKHQDKRAITQTTITYCGGRLDLAARVLGTQLATAHL